MCPRSYNEGLIRKSLRLTDIKIIISQIPDCRDIVLHGLGEPLMNQDLIDIVSFLKKIKKRVHFTTNSMLLTPRISEELIKSGLDTITISINGATSETYEHIMKGANFLNVLENIKSLVRIKEKLNASLPELNIAIVAMKSNFREIPQIIKLAVSLEIKKVIIRFLHSLTPIKEEMLTTDDLQVLRDLKNKRNPEIELITNDFGQLIDEKDKPSCNGCWEGVYITVDGWITPCCHIYNPELINFGNIFDTNFKSIWNNTYYRNFRKELLERAPKYYQECAEYLSGKSKLFIQDN
jgi:radical SAM protein with 4Fe4S-binding SPASM domain